MILHQVIHPLNVFRWNFHEPFFPVSVPFAAGLFQQFFRGTGGRGVVEPEKQSERIRLRLPDETVFFAPECERNVGFETDGALKHADAFDCVADFSVRIPLQFRIFRGKMMEQTEGASGETVNPPFQDNDIAVQHAEGFGVKLRPVRIQTVGCDEAARGIKCLLKVFNASRTGNFREKLSERNQFAEWSVVAETRAADAGNEFAPSGFRLPLHSFVINEQREIPVADCRRCAAFLFCILFCNADRFIESSRFLKLYNISA